MKRHIDWQVRLLALTESREEVPFEWGKYDCCLFAADVVKEMTGEDYAEPFRGKYTTEEGARALLDEKGGLVEYIDSVLPRKDVNFAQRGDVVLVTTDLGDTLGIFWSMGQVWLHAPEGVKLFPRMKNKITKAWGV